MIKRLLFFIVFLVSIPFASFGATVPQLASAMGREMDRQVVEHLGQTESPAQGLSLFITTPADASDLSVSNPLARQVQEELMRWFVQAGYQVHEIRKGADLLFDEEEGELLLTRTPELLGATSVGSGAVLAGTYTITPQNVRFNIRLIQTGSQEVLAMSTITVPIGPEVSALLNDSRGPKGSRGIAIEPSVLTTLP